MNQKLIIILVSLFIAGCTTVEQQPAVDVNEISIKNFVFNPQTTTVKVGTTVTWTNNDGANHQIINDATGSITKGQLFDKFLSTGDTLSYTFDKAGNYPYYCSIHPLMKGTIIVE